MGEVYRAPRWRESRLAKKVEQAFQIVTFNALFDGLTLMVTLSLTALFLEEGADYSGALKLTHGLLSLVWATFAGIAGFLAVVR